MKILSYNKKISWKPLKISSPSKRSLSTKKLNELGFKENYSLENGLRETINWFTKQYNNKSIRK